VQPPRPLFTKLYAAERRRQPAPASLRHADHGGHSQSALAAASTMIAI
jgi:hypothetical protein